MNKPQNSGFASDIDGRANLRALLDEAQPQDEMAGRVAYKAYHDVMRDFATFYGFGIVPVTEVFAALSPNNDYHGNLRSLAGVLYAHRIDAPDESAVVTTYNACRTRAFTYLRGEVSFTDTVKGRKILTFRHNILYPGTSTLVTVDGHMVGAWQGDMQLNMKDANLIFRGSKPQYDAIEKAVQRLSRRHGMAPCQMQATLWFVRKRLQANVYSNQTDMFYPAEDVSRTRVNPYDFPPFIDGAAMVAWRQFAKQRGFSHGITKQST